MSIYLKDEKNEIIYLTSDEKDLLYLFLDGEYWKWLTYPHDTPSKERSRERNINAVMSLQRKFRDVLGSSYFE